MGKCTSRHLFSVRWIESFYSKGLLINNNNNNNNNNNKLYLARVTHDSISTEKVVALGPKL